jgi:hypothetical protein
MLQKECGSFYRAVSDVLFRHDAMGLDGKHNTGDYDPKVDVLLLRIRETEHLNALQDLLFDIFLTDFSEENCVAGNSTRLQLRRSGRPTSTIVPRKLPVCRFVPSLILMPLIRPAPRRHARL